MPGRLENRRIVLGVTGSIAAYKACEVLRILQREGAEVRVVMTQAAQHFVAPLTFETLSCYEVIKEMFPANRVIKTRHISWAEWAEVIFVCPASANLIGKVASGIADDFLSTLIMAARRPVVFAPAMDYEMVQNRIYLDNVKKLKSYGCHFIDPQEGHLASGATGPGRLADFQTLLFGLTRHLTEAKTLAGKKILITAGPTREYLDPVRFLSNPSTGLMGYALAEIAWLRGADVTLISGPVEMQPPGSVKVISVQSAIEMDKAVTAQWEDTDILIMAAAVADYRPEKTEQHKMKKGQGPLNLVMVRNPDILSGLRQTKPGQLKIGFAVETQNEEMNAKKKLKEKSLDLICMNNPSVPGAGFKTNTNQITLFFRDGTAKALPLLSKRDTAIEIFNSIETFSGIGPV